MLIQSSTEVSRLLFCLSWLAIIHYINRASGPSAFMAWGDAPPAVCRDECAAALTATQNAHPRLRFNLA